MKCFFGVLFSGLLLSGFFAGCSVGKPAKIEPVQTNQMDEAMARKRIDGNQEHDYDEQPSFSMRAVDNHRSNMLDCQTIIQRLQWMQFNGLGDATSNAKQLMAAEKLKSLMLGGDGIPGDMDL